MALPDAQARRTGLPCAKRVPAATPASDGDERPMITTQAIPGIDPGAHGAVTVLGRKRRTPRRARHAVDTRGERDWRMDAIPRGVRCAPHEIHQLTKAAVMLIDGESKGRNMSTQLVQKAHDIEDIVRCSRTSGQWPRSSRWPQTSSAEKIAEWKNEMICAVESEASNAVASIRIVEFLTEKRKSVRPLPIYNPAIGFALQLETRDLWSVAQGL